MNHQDYPCTEPGHGSILLIEPDVGGYQEGGSESLQKQIHIKCKYEVASCSSWLH